MQWSRLPSWLQWLRPPQLPDPEERERAAFLHVVLLTNCILVLGALGFVPFMSADVPGSAAVVLTPLVLSIAGLVGIRYGRVRLIGLVYCLLIVAVLTTTQVVIGLNPVMLSVSLVNMTFIAGFAVSGRAAFVFGLGTAGWSTLTLWLVAKGVLPQAPYAQRPFDQAMQGGVPLILTAILITYGLTRLRTAAREARSGQEANLARAREGALIGDLGQHVVQMREPDEFSKQVISTIHDLFEPRCVAVYSRSGDRLTLVRQEGSLACPDELKGTSDDLTAYVPPLDSQPAVLDADQLAAMGEFSADSDLRGALLVIPRRAIRGGYLLVIVKEGASLHEPQVAFLRTCASLLGAANDRADTERQLRQAQKMEAVGQLAGGVAHDFNNLLTGIVGGAELAMLDLEPKHQVVPLLEDILRAGEHAALLTRQLLAFSRKEKLHPAIVDLREVVGDLKRMLGRLLGEHITLQLPTAADGDPARLLADRSALEQILLNLCLNARDAVEREGTISVAITSESGIVLLSVSDDGCGMDAETRARIFEPFFTTKGPDRGTGLGLATVHGLVAQIGGEVTVKSEVGQGARFEIRFPQAAGDSRDSDVETSAGPGGEGELVLLVEDHSLARGILRKTLQRNGYEVLIAVDGVEALELLAERDDVSVIVSDLSMPRMCGDEMLQALRERGQRTPAVFLSGYPTSSDRRSRAIETLNVPLLSKPVAADELLRVIRAEIDKART